MLLAAAGWADAVASSDYQEPTLIQIGVFLLLPIIFSLLICLVFQRIAEFVLRPKIRLNEIIIQTAYVAGSTASIALWYRLFW